MESPLSADWREFLSLLNSHRVKYVLVGAHALAIHGRARLTGDLDVFVEASSANAKRIRSALEAFGFGAVAPSIEELSKGDRVFMLGRKPYRIDILTEISGVRFQDAFRDRIRVKSEAGTLNVISREHFVANKRAAGRAKDRLDLELLGDLGGRKRRAKKREK
jgi:hypothetical protein